MRLHREEDGQAIILVGASALALLLAVAVAIGAGQLYAARRAAQNAADAAAVAGAIAMYQEGGTHDIVAAARADAARNGYTDGVGGVTVRVDRPPQGGPHEGDELYVEVVIGFPVRGVFLVGVPRGLEVRALASTASERAPDAVVTLDGGGTSLSTAGSSSISVAGADILVASRDPVAVRTDGSSTISAIGPRRIRVAGGTAGGGFSPPPESGIPLTFDDPFARYPMPDTAAMPVRTCCAPVLLPGVYPGGISTSGTVTLEPGIYVLQGGGLSLRGGASSIRGSGVLIFNTTSTYPATGGTCDAIEFQSNDFDLSAATTGVYKGLVLWQDAACTATMSLAGNANGSATGTIYLPNGGMRVASSGSVTLNSAVVTGQLALQGSAQMTVRFDPRQNARRLVQPSLAE